MSIYLDSAATTKTKEEVIAKMMPYFSEDFYNPSALYRKAKDVKNDIDSVRKTIAKFINANSNEIFFTSGGSESNCMVIDGFCKKCLLNDVTPVVVTSNIEHKSVLDCVKKSLCSIYGLSTFINVDNNGYINLNSLKEELELYSQQGNLVDVLVSIQMANNEIGVLQNIKMISEIVHEYGAILHVDAVQAFGQMEIDVKYMGIDLLSASGHKIGCPKGIGILYKNENVDIEPLIYGSQMDGLRGGTENVPYIMGMSKAVDLCCNNMMKNRIDLINKREYMIKHLVEKFKCKVNGSRVDRLPNNINVTFNNNITGEALIYLLDTSNIFIASGSACNSRINKPSHVLKSIGLSDEEAARTVRFTLPEDITHEQIDKVICEIEKAIKTLEE